MYLTTDDFLAQILLSKIHYMVSRSGNFHCYMSYELRYVQPNFDVSGTLKSVGIPELFTRALSMTVSIFKFITRTIGSFRSSRHWCMLATMYNLELSIRSRVYFCTRSSHEFPVASYLDDDAETLCGRGLPSHALDTASTSILTSLNVQGLLVCRVGLKDIPSTQYNGSTRGTEGFESEIYYEERNKVRLKEKS